MRKLTIAAGILLILGGLVVFALMNLGNLVNRNKEYILAQAEQALGRKVEVGNIGVTLSGGIGVRLKDFALADDRAFSSRDFIRAADLQVNVELLPLLWKELRVRRLILHKPVITVIRDKRGRLNFASLARPDKKARQKAQKETEPAASPAATEALPLLVSLVDVAGGEVLYLDRKDGVDVRVSQLDLTVEDVGLDRPVSIELAAAVLAERQNVKIKGHVGPLGPKLDFGAAPVKGEIEIAPINIKAVQKALPQIKQQLPRGLGLGPLEANITVSGKATSLTLSKVRVKAAVFGADKPNFQLTGRLGPLAQRLKDLSLNSDITLGPVALANLRRFAPLAGVLPPDLKAEGPLALDAHVEGTLENLALTGTVEATASAISFGNRFRKPQGVPLLLSADARVTKKRIALQKAKIELHTLKLTGNGTITRGKTPALRLALKSSRTDLNGWGETLPVLQGYNLSGGLEVNAKIQGKMKKGRTPQINGSVKLSEFRATLPQVPQPLSIPSATVTFTGQRATLQETAMRVGKSQIRLAARVERFTPLALNYRLFSPELRLADLRGVNEASKRPEVLREAKSDGRVWAEKGSLSYRGKFSSARGTLADIEYTDLQTTLSVKDQTATIDHFGFRAFHGSLQGTGRYSFRETPPRFNLTSKVRGLDLTSFFSSALAAVPKDIRGQANLDLTLAGSGSKWEEIHPTLTGQGQAEVVNGAVLNVNIAEGALSGMTGVPGISLFISPRTRSKYPAIFATRNTEFGQLKGSVSIKGGALHFDNVLIAARDWAVQGRGWVTFDRRVDLRALLVLSDKFSGDLIADAKAVRFIANRRGQVEIPFVLAGTLPSATPKPDIDYLARLVQRGLVTRGIEELQKGLFKGILPPSRRKPERERESVSPTERPRKKRPEEELLKELERLLGR